MNTRLRITAIYIFIMSLLISGCGSQQVPESTLPPTPVPTDIPTNTPIPTDIPTNTPTAIPTNTPLPTATRTPAPPTATSEPTTGSIAGKVFRSDTNQSIANAILLLMLNNTESGTFAQKVVSVTTTDADGQYSFPAVNPNSYFIWVGLEKIPEYQNYPFCSTSDIPADWVAYLTGGYPDVPVALLPPDMEFVLAAGDALQKDIDIAVINCK